MQHMKRVLWLLLACMGIASLQAQVKKQPGAKKPATASTSKSSAPTWEQELPQNRWQQKINYQIEVDMDVKTNKFSGKQKITYWNNSPDTLKQVYFHTYWNAFQPNSSMDVRSRELGKLVLRRDARGNEVRDWDARVRDRIANLKEDEIGIQKVNTVRINGVPQRTKSYETILQVQLEQPILPKSKVEMEVDFEAQVPIQIRRSGRDNAEGVRYSMAQWYPKLVEYDYQGWNANFYIAREFYGVWGDYDVKISIDRDYMIAGSGVLQNAQQIGFGYEAPGSKVERPNSPKLTWHFVANQVHDFMWAADNNYKHISKQIRKDLTIHAFYKAGTPAQDSAWNNVLWAAEKVLPYMEERFGRYPYPQYSFIQGGDGGMEYAMATLLKGSGLGTVFHEWAHSWYQMLIGTNESLFAWMDEGFTQYATDEISAHYYQNFADQSPYISEAAKKAVVNQRESYKRLPKHQASAYSSYIALAKSGVEEPLSTHADHFNNNYAYSTASYSKGAVFINQLGYIVGDQVRDQILLAYYDTWKYKHPNANDFIRVAEKVSGITLQWYKEYWVNSVKTIDYAVGDINTEDGRAVVEIKRVGYMPMPIDVLVTYKDGKEVLHHIPLDMMFGAKGDEGLIKNRKVHPHWKWTHPVYAFPIEGNVRDIKSVEIDPTQRMADINRNNNKIVIPD